MEIIQHKFLMFCISKFRHSNHSNRFTHPLTCTNHTVPYGTAVLDGRRPRHFVPGYDRTVPPGLSPFLRRLNSQTFLIFVEAYATLTPSRRHFGCTATTLPEQ